MDQSTWAHERHQAVIAEGLEGIELYRDRLDAGLLLGLQNYLAFRQETGGFLRAVLENNFQEAIGRAHPSLTLAQLKWLSELLYSYFPSPSYGSPELVEQWLSVSNVDT